MRRHMCSRMLSKPSIPSHSGKASPCRHDRYKSNKITVATHNISRKALPSSWLLHISITVSADNICRTVIRSEISKGSSSNSSSSPTRTPNPNLTPTSTPSHTSKITGSVIGGVSGLVLLAGLFFLFLRRRKFREALEHDSRRSVHEIYHHHGGHPVELDDRQVQEIGNHEAHYGGPVESGGRQVHEMGSTRQLSVG